MKRPASHCPRQMRNWSCICRPRDGHSGRQCRRGFRGHLARGRGGRPPSGKLGRKPHISTANCAAFGDDGLPSFSQTQAATDGSRGVRLVYFVFDLLHLDGGDTASLPLIEHKALLEPLVAAIHGVQFNGHETGGGELIRKHAGQLGFEGVVSKTIAAPYAPGNRGLWRKSKCLNRQEFVVVGWTDPEDRGRISARSCSATTLTTAS
jgi:ATP-dependent DNA ligase